MYLSRKIHASPQILSIRHNFWTAHWFFALLLATSIPAAFGRPAQAPSSLELSRTSRPWEFLSATGTRAGLFGNESGRIEAWVYPLKIFRDFHLTFLTEGHALPAESLVRTVTVHPESATLLYAGDTFRVRETFFVPVREQGAVILFDVETEQPLEIQATFHRDFQLEWPADLGGTFSYWNPIQHAFYCGEEQKKFAALVGSPTGAEDRAEYQTNYSESSTNSFRLGITQKGRERKVIVIAGSVNGAAEVEATYRHLSSDYEALLRDDSAYYRNYLSQTVSVAFPDAQLQQAYDWARVSLLQGLVTNPFLGTGLVAGYRTSGESQRPGFAWYFGRDSFWTSFALNAAGDFATSRAALEFISRFQRDDGKMPHEVSQGASFVNWFKDYPYPYASADATPLYIIAMNDYVVESGDTALAKEKWESLWKAYQFMKSTYDEQNFPRNFGIGHGWVEGGPLLPVKTEFYQTGLGIEALRALSNLAHLVGRGDVSKDLLEAFEHQKPLFNEAFWIAEKKRFAFALDQKNQRVDEPSVLATVPMWFRLVDEAKADAMISQLAGPDHQADWGMRIISNRSLKFSGGGYHYGSVWPLFTGWASVAEYKYHRALPAYQNLRANALLALDGSLGHTTEVLSGDYYQPLSTSSPHQIWSSAMIVNPVLRGMLGLETDAMQHILTFAPHVPADWSGFSVQNVRVGNNTLLLQYAKAEDGINLEARRTTGSDECQIEFRPAISPRAKVLKVDLDGKSVTFRVEASAEDQHVVVRFSIKEGNHRLQIRVLNDFALTASSTLPLLGSTSQGLRIISDTWSASKDQLTLEVSGAAGHEYQVSVTNARQIQSVEGAETQKTAQENTVRIRIPQSDSDPYPHAKVVFHFSAK
jgi:glycogen debranching enzyme